MNVETLPRTFSHGTLEVRDLEASMRFYRDFLGLNVSQQAPKVCFVWLQDGFGIVCLETGKKHETPLANHYGMRVVSCEEVDRWYARVRSREAEHGISEVTKPRHLHGEYQFYFRDRDDNWWEFHHPSGSDREAAVATPS